MLWNRILSIIGTACMAATAHGATVGVCVDLEGESYPLLCHTKVEIDESVLHSARWTECDGCIGPWLAVLMGNHSIACEHVGFWPEEHTEWVYPGSNTFNYTLESKALCPMPDYPYCPPEWAYCFPAVEGVHNPTSVNRMEWWYVNFHLTDEDGREYAGFVSFHKPPVLGTPALELISIVDLEYGVQYSDSGLPLLFTASDQFLDVEIGVDGRFYNRECCGVLVPWEYHLHASGVDGGVIWLDMDMRALKKPMLVSGDGHVELCGETSSFYYSHPRVDVLGTLHLPGFPALGKEVHGSAWIDHQWGDFSPVDTTWEWISIQLDDGREIMVADAWCDNEPFGSFSGGLNLYDENCELQVLENYTMCPIDTWTDPVTQREFAIAWHVTAPTRTIDLTITAVYDDQIMRLGENQIFALNFWEGACTVTGSIDCEPVQGTAMAEVTHTPPNACPPQCPADVNGDCVVDVLDLLAVLAAWGPCPGCPEDINMDCIVDVLDLLRVLEDWGPCPLRRAS